MKFLGKVFSIIAIFSLVSVGSALACSGSCKTLSSFSGKHEQMSGAFVDQATVKKGNITDGAQAVASQETKGSFKGKAGIGATAGAGLTHASTVNKKNLTISKAAAINIGASGVLGKKVCAKLSGSGEASTVAVKGGGVASSSGSFKYAGQVSNGAIVGGGATGGISGVKTGKNSVTSGAAHGTVAGVGTIKGLPSVN